MSSFKHLSPLGRVLVCASGIFQSIHTQINPSLKPEAFLINLGAVNTPKVEPLKKRFLQVNRRPRETNNSLKGKKMASRELARNRHTRRF